MKLSTVCLSLLSITTFSVSSVYAIPAVVGDLILGFRADAAPGSDTNLQVNLGPASEFFGAAPGTTTVLTRLSVQDLIETYGGSWNTRTDLSWGVVGATGASVVNAVPARTIWASAPQAVPGTAGPAWQRSSASGQQNSASAITTLYSGAPGSIVSVVNPTTNSPFSVKVGSATAGSWTVQEDLVTGQSFRRFTPTVRQAGNTFPVAGSAYDGTGYTVLDLWDIRPGSGAATLLGGIGLNSAGKLVFSTDVSRFAPTSNTVELGSPVITYSGGTVTVTLAGAPPGTYVLERSTTMAALSWTDQGAPQTPVGGLLTYTDNNPPAFRGFYRIKKTS